MPKVGPLAQIWYRWKALRLPWRKRFFVERNRAVEKPFYVPGVALLVPQTLTYSFPRPFSVSDDAGYDLQGNTFWEFRLSSDTRWRRIVKYPRSTPYSQVAVTPLWHQWLRHTRAEPPSLEEQTGDVVRQERMKFLAKEADERWEAKPRVMESSSPTARPAALLGEEGSLLPPKKKKSREKQQQSRDGGDGGHDPWARAREAQQGQGETWQPTSWTPPAPTNKR
ncbi:NADH:ubiquinone oxidoreductase, 17.2kDa subunit [Moelleriella libera RCEF 2490]|uniref:NADH:ubiquinone oxidoreductase, 17.2kDa subunit n=1 Tax=Moelleriella libera RCEF 2490 TaxID=1081109 RepID=A0A168DCQ2_9HYPO|nr:NADH:ubiquinone oxidoreductase, 17.2kDa subunit [Moelleriella libera RCEF 2490]